MAELASSSVLNLMIRCAFCWFSLRLVAGVEDPSMV